MEGVSTMQISRINIKSNLVNKRGNSNQQKTLIKSAELNQTSFKGQQTSIIMLALREKIHAFFAPMCNTKGVLNDLAGNKVTRRRGLRAIGSPNLTKSITQNRTKNPVVRHK